jgi:hypothetical protein
MFHLYLYHTDTVWRQHNKEYPSHGAAADAAETEVAELLKKFPEEADRVGFAVVPCFLILCPES